jgi:exodeoxyribonuclease-5
LIELSEDQKEALRAVRDASQEGNPLVTLGGYAGTGKSTLIPFIAQELGSLGKTAFVCFTGKASGVLRKKLRDSGIEEHVLGYSGTIHGLIYEPILDPDGDVKGWHRKESLGSIERIIVDEVSMVGREILEDLQSYGVPIVAVGDPAQLPPVNDVSVIEKPMVLLSKIHRQAEGNPIIKLAAHVREHGNLPEFKDSEHVRHIGYAEAGPIIDGFRKESPLDFCLLARSNKARVWMNQEAHGRVPKVGDVVVCLKNNYNSGFFNGMRGIIKKGTFEKVPRGEQRKPWQATVDFVDEGFIASCYMNQPQFGRSKTYTISDMYKEHKTKTLYELFDFGTALTVHKAQGSSFRDVFVSPERWAWNKTEKGDWAKWLYTAVTRASENLYFLPEW